MSEQPAPYTCKHSCERDELKDRITALEAENKALRERNAELCDVLQGVLSLAKSYLFIMPDRHGVHAPKLDRARALLAKEAGE